MVSKLFDGAGIVANKVTIFAVHNTKLYVLVVTCQLKVMQNYYNNWNLVFKEKLTGINNNQK